MSEWTEDEYLRGSMTLEDDEPMSELTNQPFDTRETEMPTSSAPSASTFVSDGNPKPKSPRKQRRVGPDGRLLKRMVLALIDSDYGTISTAIATRSSPLFTRAFGGAPVSSTGSQDEDFGAALAMICDDWLTGITKTDD